MAGVAGEVNGGECHDLRSLLSGDDGRDFLVRSNGDQVKVVDLGLDGKIVGLYFSGHWCPPCRGFTPKLAEAYAELFPRGGFEVVFVSSDRDEDSFLGYLSEMPWLAIPFADAAARSRLKGLFGVRGIPFLVVIDGSTGKVVTANAVGAVRGHGAEAYPFTPERVAELKAAEEEAKREQTLRSVLTSASRDYVLNSHGDKVPVSELEGKVVGLYFSVSSHRPCIEFTKMLAKMYQELKEREESFEVVLVPLDGDNESFEEAFKSMPWLTVPFNDKSCEKLARYFDIRNILTLIVIGPDGKTLHADATELVEEHGIDAYPFSPEKLAELVEIGRAREEVQTLESLLVSGDLDYVIGKENVQIPVSELVGKNILLYFSAHWCPPCRGFTPKLVEAYREIKAKHSEFEVIFISSDRDQSSFEEYYSGMPWLALPFGDERKKSLSRKFKVQGIPSLVAIGPSGRTGTKDARGMVMEHGSAAYPFTEERIRELNAEMEEMAKGWPEKLKHVLHKEHELVRTRRMAYECDGCGEGGNGWSFYCKKCDFDLHPKCALKKEEKKETANEGYVCEGGICYKKT